MLVSNDRKLVFVHIQKAGGVTVHELLRERIHDLRNILARHAFASRGVEELEDWDDYFKFAFVRNPWDRLVSWYSMIRANLSEVQETEQRPWHKLLRYVQDNSATFEEFIHNCTDEVEIKEGIRYSFAYNQLDYVTDEHGKMLVDFIGRLENFDEDIQRVFRRIGFELETVPRINPSEHRHYSTFYTPETEMIVRERFERDIEYFGYEFEGPAKPGPLFVCGCDSSGTTALVDYLNRHPEVLVCQERSERTQQGGISLNLSTFEKMLDSPPEETEGSAPHGGGDRLVKPRPELLASKDPARLRWIGASNPDYVRRMESVASNNPGARFIVMYRPVEEIAESHSRPVQAIKIWNRSLQGARRFIRESVVPRVLLISYHDLLYRTETVVPLISHFLGLKLDESVRAGPGDEVLQSGRVRPGETPGREKRSMIQKHANRAAEAWILDRIEKQWEKPELYTQETSKAALAASLEETEARAWRLQQKVKELERDGKRTSRRLKELQGSRTWKLLDRIGSIRARIAGR